MHVLAPGSWGPEGPWSCVLICDACIGNLKLRSLDLCLHMWCMYRQLEVEVQRVPGLVSWYVMHVSAGEDRCRSVRKQKDDTGVQRYNHKHEINLGNDFICLYHKIICTWGRATIQSYLKYEINFANQMQIQLLWMKLLRKNQFWKVLKSVTRVKCDPWPGVSETPGGQAGDRKVVPTTEPVNAQHVVAPLHDTHFSILKQIESLFVEVSRV